MTDDVAAQQVEDELGFAQEHQAEDLVPAQAEELVWEASRTPGGVTLYGVHARVERGLWTIVDADDRQDAARSTTLATLLAAQAIRRGAR